MSTLGTYSFLPWLRQGIANQITDADEDAGVRVRAHVDVGLELRGDKLDGGTDTKPVSKPVALAGPGDIVGIDPRTVVRLEPHDWITNFEPNYLAAIDFYDEDFPWRYTPAKADTVRGRLRPWIALVVLKDDEFRDGPSNDPLPSIIVNDPATVFPRPDELWAWAHVHVNRSLGANPAEVVSTDAGEIVPRLRAVLNENEDLAYSRLMCPRKLEPNTAYNAFVVPVFETGRRAGLKITIGDVKATQSAWDPPPGDGRFPCYFRWYFRTGSDGDFETLVRLLVPQPVDPRVGRREMDVQHPAPNVRGVDNPDLGGILRLGGALQAPRIDPPDVFDRWDVPYPRPLQADLATLIDLPDDLQVAGHPDPIITPPLYGRWHAMTSRVLTDRDGTPLQPAETWVSRTNLDPRYRVAAGLGTRVIQDQQETYMDAAWNQIGDILAAQQRIRYGQFGVLASTVWYDRHLVTTMNAGTQQGLMLLAPLNKRVLHDGATIYHLYSQSLVQPTMTSGALRRVVRPRGRLVQQLAFTATNPPTKMLERGQRRQRVGSPAEGHPTWSRDRHRRGGCRAQWSRARLADRMAAPFPMAALLAARPRRSDRGHPHRRGARRRHHRRGRGAGPDRHRTNVAVVAMASPRRRCRPDPPRPHRRRPCPAPAGTRLRHPGSDEHAHPAGPGRQ